jgi:hypothetical protein
MENAERGENTEEAKHGDTETLRSEETKGE